MHNSDHSSVLQSRAEQSRAEQSRTDQSIGEERKAEQSRVEQSRVEQSRAKARARAALNATEHNDQSSLSRGCSLLDYPIYRESSSLKALSPYK